jgi:ATP-dependent protease ClpP protease subunit
MSTSELDIKNQLNSEQYKTIMKILAKHTGKTLKEIKEDCKQDVWLTPMQCCEYGKLGICDYILV